MRKGSDTQASTPSEKRVKI
jgi:hypothetical protein